MNLNALFKVGDHVEFVKTQRVAYRGQFPLEDTLNYVGKDFLIDEVKFIENKPFYLWGKTYYSEEALRKKIVTKECCINCEILRQFNEKEQAGV